MISVFAIATTSGATRTVQGQTDFETPQNVQLQIGTETVLLRPVDARELGDWLITTARACAGSGKSKR